MHSQAHSVDAYIAELSVERRAVIQGIREVVLAHLPPGYEETLQYGMISYVVPLSRYPAGYLGKKSVPLPYISLASQKHYCSLYLLALYADRSAMKWLEQTYARTGKKLDMGKSCIRFKQLDDVPLDVLGDAVARFSVADFITLYEKRRS